MVPGKKNPIRCIDHSFFWMDPVKKPIRCINHSFFWMDLGENPIRCINHSFFWMDPGKNPIRCINHSFFWMDPGKIPIRCINHSFFFGVSRKKPREATSFPGSLFSASIVVVKRPWFTLVTWHSSTNIFPLGSCFRYILIAQLGERVFVWQGIFYISYLYLTM